MAGGGAAVFTIGGNLIGSYLGGPVGGAIGGLAGGLIGSLIFNRTKKPLIADLNLMNSSYGNPIPLLWGTALLPGTIIWMTPVQVVNSSSGKGGPSAKANAPSVYQSAGIAFLEVIQGRSASMSQLFLNGQLFVDQLSGGGGFGAVIEIAIKQFAIRTYHGDEAQLPDYIYVEWCAANVTPPQAVPANRGLAYLVFDRINIENYGQVFPQTTAIWTTSTDIATSVASFTSTTVLGSLTTTASFYGGVAVDWTRGYVYTLTNIATVTQFSLATGKQVAQKSFADVIGPNGAIYCGPGTNLYLFGGSLTNEAVVIKISPIGLSSGAPVQIHGAGAGFSSTFMVGPSVVVGINSQNGYFEIIAGTFLPNSPEVPSLTLGGPPSLQAAFFLDPITGFSSLAPLQYNDLFAHAVVCAGNVASDGSTDVWFLNWDSLDSSQTLYLHKGVITQGILSSLTDSISTIDLSLVATFSPADFGLGTIGAAADGVIAYDRSRGALIICANGWAAGVATFEWSPTTGIIWTSPQHLYLGGAVTDSGSIGMVDVSGGILISTNNGAVTTSPLPAGAQPPSGLSGQQFYNSSGNIAIYGVNSVGGTTLYMAKINRTVTSEYPVASIITDICAFGGLTPADIDVSLVTQTTSGYVIRDHKSVGAALVDLCHVYLIDIIESDFKLKFVPRGYPSVVTIPQRDLASIDSKDRSRYWTPLRSQELELPLTLNVKYSDVDLQGQPGAAFARRTALPWPTTFSKRRLVMDLPIVANNTEARHIAENLLFTMWQERKTYETMLGMKYLQLDAGDNVFVQLDNGAGYFVRLQEQSVSPDLMQRPTFCSENVAVYGQSTSPGATYGSPPPVVQQTAFGALLQFNVPLLQDADAIAGATRIYAAAGSQGAPWVGGGLFKSPDNVNWALLKTVGPPASYGYATTVLPDLVAKFATDKKNTVTVTLAPGDTIPASITYTEMMDGGNAALLGSELIQFQNVTENSDGTITLDTLTRGNRGTEWATGTHQLNELFVMLVAGELIGAQLTLGEIGVSEYYELLPNGAFLDQVPSAQFTYLGYDLKPYAPYGFARANSGSDLQFSWLRRTRIGGLLIDGTDTVPLNEDTEAYEAYLLADNNPATRAAFDPTNALTYKRAFTGLTSPQVLYTAAEMTADSFTRATDGAPLGVYQVSGTVGRGFLGFEYLPPF